jgi:hypothetical protein
MNDQILTKLSMICNFVVAFPVADFLSSQSVFVSPRDYGFDIDEDEIASGLLASLPIPSKAAPDDVAMDEFETVYQWFIA